MKPVSEYLTATRQFFGDGEYWLHLKMPQMNEFERAGSGRSVMATYAQLLDGFIEIEGKMRLLGSSNVPASVVNEIVRLGLIGGNAGPADADGDTTVGPKRAEALVSNYGFPNRPIEEVGAVAFRLLHAVIYGDPAQREAMPDKAAQSDAEGARLSKSIAEQLGPTMRKRAKEAGG